MSRSGSRGRSTGADTPFILLSCVVLLICGYYVSLKLGATDPGFEIDPLTWTVTAGQKDCTEGVECLMRGDRILEIGSISREAYLEDRTLAVRWLDGGTPIRFERQGQELEVAVPTSDAAPLARQIEVGLTSLIPIVFWLIGILSIVFIRPRDDRRLLLTLLSFDVAIWFASGSISASQQGYSVIVFHVFVWWFLPLAVHLHLILPDAPFRRFHPMLLPPLYAATVVLSTLDLFHLLPDRIILWPAAAAVVTSMGLLTYRLSSPASPAITTANRLMLFGIAFGLGPWLLVSILALLVLPETSQGELGIPLVLRAVFLTAVPAWPLAYAYAIYKHKLGSLEFRANRLLGVYGFAILCVLTFALLLLAGSHWPLFAQQPTPFMFAILLLFVIFGPSLRSRFQALTDRFVFGIEHDPDQAFVAFTRKLPAAFDVESLQRVIVHDITPVLQIRQSALYLFAGTEIDPVYEQRLPETVGGLSRDEARELKLQSGRYLREVDDGSFAWVRLVVRLTFENEELGIWLFGTRDPDDFYTRSDIVLLESLASQMAAVIRADREAEVNKRLQQQLFSSQKLEAVGRLSAGIAHDFNNLLAVIHLNSEFLLARIGDDPTCRKYVAGITEAADRATALTKELLTFSRQQVIETQVVDLNATISNLENMLNTLVGDGVVLALDLAPRLPSVKVDPGHLEQVIVNLAMNANDAMPEGGKLTLETGLEADGTGLPDSERTVTLRVRDTGTGIDPEVKARMFEPFFTTKDAGKGTGLGLSIVYGIVNQSHGHLDVESEPNRGTTFSVALPAAEETAAESDETTQEVSIRPAGGKILLVEDEAGLRSVIGEALESEGYEILAAANGVDALKAAEGRGHELDLLLTDVAMPKMKGTVLARHMLEAYPDLAVLFMSGYNEESLDSEIFEGHLVALIQKPFSASDLASRVRGILKKRRKRARKSAGDTKASAS